MYQTRTSIIQLKLSPGILGSYSGVLRFSPSLCSLCFFSWSLVKLMYKVLGKRSSTYCPGVRKQCNRSSIKRRVKSTTDSSTYSASTNNVQWLQNLPSASRPQQHQDTSSHIVHVYNGTWIPLVYFFRVCSKGGTGSLGRESWYMYICPLTYFPSSCFGSCGIGIFRSGLPPASVVTGIADSQLAIAQPTRHVMWF